MIENSGMQVSQLLCYLSHQYKNSVWVVNFFQASFGLCGVSFSELLLLYFMLGKSMQIPVGVVCLFVCLFLPCGKQRELELFSIMHNKQSEAKQQGVWHTVALPI